MSRHLHRVAFLQKAPSGHMDACLRALSGTGEVELLATIPSTLADSPFEEDEREWIDHRVAIAGLGRSSTLLATLTDFDPDLLIAVGWEPPAYRQAARALRDSARRIVCMDHQYRGTLKQRAGVLASDVYLKPYFDGAFVAGERQRQFARRLGFAGENVFDGFYSCDVDLFSAVPALDETSIEQRRRFLVVARLVPDKGIDVLVEAYERYRSRVDNPWELVVVGTGPLSATVDGRPGVDVRGFVQPSSLPDVFAEAACLVLPSVFEPWGVVVHEAAAAGLGIVCTAAVGASDAFVQSGRNGVVVPPRDVDRLSEALVGIHDLSPPELEDLSRSARRLASKITPRSWASTVLSMVR